MDLDEFKAEEERAKKVAPKREVKALPPAPVRSPGLTGIVGARTHNGRVLPGPFIQEDELTGRVHYMYMRPDGTVVPIDDWGF